MHAHDMYVFHFLIGLHTFFQIEREEKERKRAMFERKLSKFSVGSEEGGCNGSHGHPPLVKKLSHVDKMAKKFSYERKSEEEEREIRRRREEFERKRSGFMSDTDDSTSRKTSAEEEENAEESRNRCALSTHFHIRLISLHTFFLTQDTLA